jgi:hypothetical protein
MLDSNLVEGNQSGVGMNEAGTPMIFNNTIRRNHGDGMSMGNRCDAAIIQNLIVENDGNGIGWLVPWGTRGPLVLNNTIVGNGVISGAGISSAGQGLIINNIAVGNPALMGTASVIQFNDFFSPEGAPYGGSGPNLTGLDGNISADPFFACPRTGDYHLLRNSPCIDRGTNGAPSLPALDFYGAARLLAGSTNGTATVDIGADEFDPSTTISGCPTVSYPSPITTECGAPAELTVTVGETDGGPLIVVWTLNGTAMQTNAVPARNPPATTAVSFVATAPLGSNVVAVAVTDSWTNTIYGLLPLTVIDSTPPALICPSSIITEFESDAGAPVFFSAVSTDRCSGPVAVISAPPSGSRFPIGTNVVTCLAEDNAGNRSQCSFEAVVLGARGVMRDVLTEMRAFDATQTHRVHLLEPAIGCLTRSLAPELWDDEVSLSTKSGGKVFAEAAETARLLVRLLEGKESGIPNSLLQNWIDRLIKATRLVAVLELRTAADSPAPRKALRNAGEEIAEGDQAVSDQHYPSAVRDYGNAWSLAAHSAVHHASLGFHDSRSVSAWQGPFTNSRHHRTPCAHDG